MDAQLKAKWVEALRSGDYTQTDGHLYHKATGGFCCLGVLASICGAEFGSYVSDEGREYKEEAMLDGELVSELESQELNARFVTKIGLPDQSILMGLNDGAWLTDPSHPRFVRKHTFTEIADYIETNIPIDTADLPSDDRSVVGGE